MRCTCVIYKHHTYMNTKLTLTLEKEIIEQAKKYASNKGRSLSEIVENYFKFLTQNEEDKSSPKLSRRINKLRGILKVEENFNYKKVLEEELTRKYYE